MKNFFLLLLITGVFQIFAFAQTQNSKSPMPCPKFSIEAPENFTDADNQLSYEAIIRDEDFDVSNLKYRWTVSGGSIISGQNTKSITVRQENLNEISVTVNLSGLPEGRRSDCSTSVTQSCDHCGVIKPKPFQIDGYPKISFSEEKNHLKTLTVELNKTPDSAAFIKKSFTRNISKAAAYSSLQRTINYLTSRGIDKRRIAFCAEYDVNDRTEIWIIPVVTNFPECNDETLDAAKLQERIKPKTRRK